MRVIIRFWLILILFLACLCGSARADEFNCTYCHSEMLIQTNRDCPKWQKNSHPVNIFPSRLVDIPDDLPLDNGKLACNTCHIILPGEKGEGDILTLRTIDDGSSFCKRCHVRKLAKDNTVLEQDVSPKFDRLVDDDYLPESSTGFDVGFRKSFSHPINKDSMRIPRIIVERGGKLGKTKNEIICQTCHAMHNAERKNLLVLNNDRSQLCGTCHSRMFGINRLQSSLKGTHPINTVPRGVSLFEFLATTKGKVGVDNTIGCQTCHSVHYAKQERGLLVDLNVKNSFCFKCHENQLKFIEGTKHDLTGREEAANLRGEPAGLAGVCSACHFVHGGSGPKIWSRFLPGKKRRKDIIRQLCLSCHRKGGLAEKSTIGKFSHPTAVNISKIDKDYVSLPLYEPVSGAPAGRGDVTCATCHNVHRWDPETEVKNSDKEETNSFLRYGNLKSSLCFRCHQKQNTIVGTTHDLNGEMYKNATVPLRLLSNKQIEKPETRSERDEGICGQCHSPHNAVTVKLWNRQLGEGEDEISKICLGCHTDEVVAAGKQVGDYSHPVNVPIEKLSFPIKTVLPLFKNNYQASSTGKVFCNTCHDIHQWIPKKEQRGGIEREEGDGNSSYLRLSVNDPENPLCQECHIPQRPVAGTDHDLNVSAPDEINLQRETVKQSGICGSCHAAHNAASKLFLWNKDLSDREDYISEICSSCHRQDGCASSKLTGEHSHPVNVSTFSVLDDITSTILPIYNTNYRRVELPSQTPISPNFIDSVYQNRKFDSTLYKKDRKLLKMFRLYKQNYLDLKNILDELRAVATDNIKAKQEIKVKIMKMQPRLEKLDQKIRDKVEQQNQHKLEGEKLFAKQEKSLKQQEEIKDLVKKEEVKSYNKLQKTGTKAGPRKFVLGKIKEKEKKGESPVKSKREIAQTAEREKKIADILKTKKSKLEFRTKKLDNLLEALEAVNLEVSTVEQEVKDHREHLETMEEELVEFNNRRNELVVLIGKEETVYEKYTLRLNKVKDRYDRLQDRKEELRENILDINPLAFNEERYNPLEEFEISFSEIIPLNYEQKYELLIKEQKSLEKRITRDKKKYDLLRVKFQEILVNPDLIKDITQLELSESVEEGLVEYIESREEPPQGVILCTSCHNVHIWDPTDLHEGDGKEKEGDKLNSFLRIPNRNGLELCVNCHQDKKFIEKTAHDLRYTAPQSKNILGQPPEESGVCGSCHQVHNARSWTMLWGRFLKKGNLEALQDRQAKGRKITAAMKLAKRAYFKYKKKKRQLGKPFLEMKVQLSKQRKGVEKFKAFVEKINERYRDKRKSSYLINKLNKYKTKYENKLAVFKRNSRKFKKLENQIEQVDALIKEKSDFIKSNLPRLQKLKAEYKALIEQQRKSNLDAMSRLCESCHFLGKLAGQSLVGENTHPMNVKAKVVSEKIEEENKIEEEFPYPLYDYAGSRKYESGRIFCPTCHDLHKWDPDKDEPGSGTKTVNRDGTNSFLRDSSVSSGKLCTRCHPDKAEVFGSKHDLSLNLPESVNIKGEKVAKSGVCGVCHVAHNAGVKRRIWAREPGPGVLATWKKSNALEEDTNPRLCTSCHAPEGLASQTIPSKALHPGQPNFYLKEVETPLEKPKFPYYSYKDGNYQKILAVSEIYDNRAKPKFPVYTEEGAKSVYGNIACMTCHDPHRWSAEKEEKITGLTNVSTSFLRTGTAQGFCADCHGISALRSYAFFHGSKKETENPTAHWQEKMEETACLTQCHQTNSRDCFHPSSLKLTEEQQDFIPENFPLTQAGVMTCITCHDPGLQTAEYAGNREVNPRFLRGIFDKPIKRKKRSKKPKTKVPGAPSGPPALRKGGKAQPRNRMMQMEQISAGPKRSRLSKFKLKQQSKREQEREKLKQIRQGALRQKLISIKKKQKKLAEEKRNKYCLFCHDKNQFKVFSVHQRQLDQGKRVYEVCKLCHSRIPRRTSPVQPERFSGAGKKMLETLNQPVHQRETSSSFSRPPAPVNIQSPQTKLESIEEKKEINNFLRVEPDKICVGCHPGKENHPAGRNHFMAALTEKQKKKINSSKGVNKYFYVPFAGDKVTCYTCHDPHPPGVIRSVRHRIRERNAHFLRLRPGNRCSYCHEK